MLTQAQGDVFVTLDGLRGVAALAVLIFHVNGILAGFDFSAMLIPHAYLAVDFFFMLSGFVIAYTYDRRWSYLSVPEFFRLRLIRLHPLVLLAMLLGLLGNLLNPYDPDSLPDRLPAVLLTFCLGLFLIVSPSASPHREDATFSLNSPLWSLSLEYAANILYACLLRRMRQTHLALCAALCCLGLIIMASSTDSFVGGFSWPTLWVAPFRLLPPFLLGVLCARAAWRQRLPKLNFFALAGVLVLLLCMPVWPRAPGFSLNGLFDSLCVVCVFPLLILCGTSVPHGTLTKAGCMLAGRLSYPVYILHMPLVYLYAEYVRRAQPDAISLVLSDCALILACIALGWLASRYWDLPLRKKWKICSERRSRTQPRAGKAC